jgi:hypothetical protein
MWSHVYDPLGNPWLSTLCAALPVIVLLGALGIFHIKAHIAAVMGLITSLVVAIGIFGMPGSMALSATLMGAANGLLPIGWIILNVIFLYQLTERKGQFAILRESITGVTQDRRLQLLLIAFCFGAFFEGAGGFGTPVAVTGAMLIGLGFSPLAASGLSLIANTAPVAYGGWAPDHHPGQGNRHRRDADFLHGGSSDDHLRRHRAVLAADCLLWLEKHPAHLACRAGGWLVLCHSAADRLQYHGA